MSTELSRVLEHLRKEKGIKQKEAAEALGISSGLLSHYEKGRRAPKLEFLAKAAKYYGVSSDYLLGVSNMRAPVNLTASSLMQPPTEAEKVMGRGGLRISLGKAMALSSVNVLFELMRDDAYKEFSIEAQNYLALSIYKIFRHLYNSNPDNLKSFFSMPDLAFLEAGNAASQMTELRLKLHSAKISKGKDSVEEINYDKIKEEFSRDAPAFFNILKMAEDSMSNAGI